jgi:hypothetical protein
MEDWWHSLSAVSSKNVNWPLAETKLFEVVEGTLAPFRK